MHANPEKQNEQSLRIQENLKRIKRIIMVMSGKGGVGKSTVSTNLAYAFAMRDMKVGIMDIDIHGPNIPKMLGIEDQRFYGSEQSIEPVEVLPNLFAASVGLAGYDPDQAFIWRGPIKIGLIRQFLGDVTWGDLDYLIIDTPPGTGDEALTAAQLIPIMAGAVVVTSPQDVSILDSRKSVDFAKKLNLPVLGIIENMSGFICPHCGEKTEIFSAGGGKRASETLGVPFLGEIPLEPRVVLTGDSGEPFVSSYPDSPTTTAFVSIIERIERQIERYEGDGLYAKPQRALEKLFDKKPGARGDFKPER